MSNTQPEALRLADALGNAIKQTDTEDDVILVARWFVEDAATELRRLHSVNADLLGALTLTNIDCQRLHHAYKDRHTLDKDCPVVARINAAIAKATGGEA